MGDGAGAQRAGDDAPAALLVAADAARAAGQLEDAEALFLSSFERARVTGDGRSMGAAALGLTDRGFGLAPGRVPALLHEAYECAADPHDRARLAVALTRSWVYGGEPRLGMPFASEAVRLAEASGDQVLLADALDAALLVRWGPDDFAERLMLTTRLAETTTHLRDTEARLAALLWRLSTAAEALDGIALLRQLRALDLLAAESPDQRIRFFAESRRAMYTLAIGEHELAAELIDHVQNIDTPISDRTAVIHSLTAQLAYQRADRATAAMEAAAFEQFGLSEAVPSIIAQAALYWATAGDHDRAAALAARVIGDGLHSTPRDVDFLLTTTSLMHVALATDRADVLRDGMQLLAPYARRGVVNAGAVTFHGVVADVLHRAAQQLGDDRGSDWLTDARDAYTRLGATWWLNSLAPQQKPAQPRDTTVVHLRPTANALWVVGFDGSSGVLPDRKGLHYLRTLATHPGRDFTALELVASVAGNTGVATDSNAGELLDAAAKTAYRRRLADLDEEITEAVGWSDETRATRLRLERDALLEQLAAATGLFGRDRLAGSSAERARVAVRKAIVAALEQISHHDPTVARLIRDSVQTGRICRFNPDPARQLRWRLT